VSRTHATDSALASAELHRASDLFTLRRPHETPKHFAGPSTHTADAGRQTLLFFRKELPFAGYSVVKELSILARPACIASSTRLRALRVVERGSASKLYVVLVRLRRDNRRDRMRACLAEARLRVSPGGRRLVENTGLEPVTSWLQTRRSPS
jgi:hypothetical protein